MRPTPSRSTQFRCVIDLERKPDRTFVTVADQGIEREIRSRIHARYPDHGLVGEEYGVEAGDAQTRWVIDPIDATHYYIRGIPLFGTLLGIEHDGELQVGVISAPALRERWYAYRGGGAWNRNPDGERRIRVSRVGALEDAQVVYGSRRDAVASGLMPGFDALIDASWRERGFGDFWGYALVAEGAAEVMLEVGMEVVDLAGPLVVIEEQVARSRTPRACAATTRRRSSARTGCSTTRSSSASAAPHGRRLRARR